MGMATAAGDVLEDHAGGRSTEGSDVDMCNLWKEGSKMAMQKLFWWKDALQRLL